MTEQDYLRELAARDQVIEQQAALISQWEAEVLRLKQLLHNQS